MLQLTSTTRFHQTVRFGYPQGESRLSQRDSPSRSAGELTLFGGDRTVSRALGLCLLAAACVLAACAQSPTVASTPTLSAAPTALPTRNTAPTSVSTSAATPVSAPSPAAGTPVSSTPASLTPGAAVPPEASALVEEARTAVAQEVGVPAAQVAVVSVQMVEWPDPSLGCPEPGMAYAQMVTPGYLIKLSAGGKTFEYHSDRQDTVVTCANPRPPTRVE